MTLEEALAELSEAKTSIEALAGKNKELLNEVKTERKAKRETDADSEKYYKLKDEFDDLKDNSKKLEHELKSRDKDIAKLTESNTGLNTNLQNVLIEGGISDGLAKIGIRPDFLLDAKDLLSKRVKVVEGKAVVGDKSLEDYMADWSTGDGKKYTLAKDNTGGGANGGNKSGGADNKEAPKSDRETYEAMFPTQQQG